MQEADDTDFDLGYQAGCEASRAAMTTDIRALVDHFHSELRALRVEIAALAGIPPALLEPPNGRLGPQ